MAQLEPGQRIGEYVLDRVAGRGAFGEVWRATHHVWRDSVVAVKVPTDPAYLRSLRQEGQAVHALAHPNIARALGFDPFAQTPYLVVEYVGGGSLRDHLNTHGPMSPGEASAALRQVLLGLSHAHTRGVLHGDVKPENVLLAEGAAAGGFAEGGTVKLTDFGLGVAGMAADPAALAQSIAYSMDAVSGDGAKQQLAGTLDYMAPEVRAGEPPTEQADLYACGVVLFEMLTGEKPAGNEVPSELVKGVPPLMDTAFRRSVVRRRRRYVTAHEMAEVLARAVESPPPLPAPPPMPPVPTPARIVGNVAPPGDCPRCGGEVGGGDQFCMTCGHQLKASVRRCGRCGAFPSPDDAFCIFCGNTLAGAKGGA